MEVERASTRRSAADRLRQSALLLEAAAEAWQTNRWSDPRGFGCALDVGRESGTFKAVSKRPDTETRQELRAQYKRADRREWEARLPLDADALNALLDHLDEQVGLRGCDHTLAATKAWLAAHDHDIETVAEGFRGLGAACDCEVLANVDPETHS